LDRRLDDFDDMGRDLLRMLRLLTLDRMLSSISDLGNRYVLYDLVVDYLDLGSIKNMGNMLKREGSALNLSEDNNEDPHGIAPSNISEVTKNSLSDHDLSQSPFDPIRHATSTYSFTEVPQIPEAPPSPLSHHIELFSVEHIPYVNQIAEIPDSEPSPVVHHIELFSMEHLTTDLIPDSYQSGAPKINVELQKPMV